MPLRSSVATTSIQRTGSSSERASSVRTSLKGAPERLLITLTAGSR